MIRYLMLHQGLEVKPYWLRLLLVIVVSTWIGLAVTVLALRRFAPRPDTPDRPQTKEAGHG